MTLKKPSLPASGKTLMRWLNSQSVVPVNTRAAMPSWVSLMASTVSVARARLLASLLSFCRAVVGLATLPGLATMVLAVATVPAQANNPTRLQAISASAPCGLRRWV